VHLLPAIETAAARHEELLRARRELDVIALPEAPASARSRLHSFA
jgi:hypothetical protein